jgi:hypothetical protein
MPSGPDGPVVKSVVVVVPGLVVVVLGDVVVVALAPPPGYVGVGVERLVKYQMTDVSTTTTTTR